MGSLADEVKKRNPYLTLNPGESTVVTYKGFKMITSNFDPEKDMYRFILQVNVNGEPMTKYWDTGSNKVAMIFDKVPEGGKVKITKNVKVTSNGKEQTSYDVVPVVDDDGSVTAEEAKDIAEEMAG